MNRWKHCWNNWWSEMESIMEEMRAAGMSVISSWMSEKQKTNGINWIYESWWNLLLFGCCWTAVFFLQFHSFILHEFHWSIIVGGGIAHSSNSNKQTTIHLLFNKDKSNNSLINQIKQKVKNDFSLSFS